MPERREPVRHRQRQRQSGAGVMDKKKSLNIEMHLQQIKDIVTNEVKVALRKDLDKLHQRVEEESKKAIAKVCARINLQLIATTKDEIKMPLVFGDFL